MDVMFPDHDLVMGTKNFVKSGQFSQKTQLEIFFADINFNIFVICFFFIYYCNKDDLTLEKI